jgi:hypothetical protein
MVANIAIGFQRSISLSTHSKIEESIETAAISKERVVVVISLNLDFKKYNFKRIELNFASF